MNTHEFIVGDIGYFTHTDGQIHPFKIIAISETGAPVPTWHLSMYTPTATPITESDIPQLLVDTMHVPIVAFPDTSVYVGHTDVDQIEKEVYFEYLKQIDFRAYVAESGIDASALIAEAKVFYQQGYEFTTQKREEDAIVAYTQAIAIFPLFTEALDNRAFVYMDRGDFESASKDFRQSLAVEPTFLAQFSLAECFFKSGEYTLAQEELEKAKTLGDDPHVAELEAKINEALAVSS